MAAQRPVLHITSVKMKSETDNVISNSKNSSSSIVPVNECHSNPSLPEQISATIKLRDCTRSSNPPPCTASGRGAQIPVHAEAMFKKYCHFLTASYPQSMTSPKTMRSSPAVQGSARAPSAMKEGRALPEEVHSQLDFCKDAFLD